MKQFIENSSELATTDQRKDALEIVEAGLNAIDTQAVLKNLIKREDDVIYIGNRSYTLSLYDNLYVLGFGKSSCGAAHALEEILGDAITAGVFIDRQRAQCNIVEVIQAQHPIATSANVQASKKLISIAHRATEKDLVIVVVSGGGSALLCGSESEREQSERLYNEFLKVATHITRLNTVRKHLSTVKGGGLAKILYPAEVVSLVFSDVPGGTIADVASGPTSFDTSTLEEAKIILSEYHLQDKFTLTETPKDRKYFEKIFHIEAVSNTIALEAMKQHAQTLGYNAHILSNRMYDPIDEALKRIITPRDGINVMLSGGEVSFIVADTSGKGGRNLHSTAKMLPLLQDGHLFASIASDGWDNSDFAGAIADDETKKAISEQKLDVQDFINRFDGYTLFEKANQAMKTGALESNVADLSLYMSK